MGAKTHPHYVDLAARQRHSAVGGGNFNFEKTNVSAQRKRLRGNCNGSNATHHSHSLQYLLCLSGGHNERKQKKSRCPSLLRFPHRYYKRTPPYRTPQCKSRSPYSAPAIEMPLQRLVCAVPPMYKEIPCLCCHAAAVLGGYSLCLHMWNCPDDRLLLLPMHACSSRLQR